MKKRLLALVMAFILLIPAFLVPGAATSSPTYSTYPGVDFLSANISLQRKAALTKAMQMVTVKWICPADFPTWRSSGGELNTVTATDGTSSTKFIKGKTYTGIPYSMDDNIFDDVSWVNAVSNGKITTSYMTGDFYGNGPSTAHGSDCSYFVFHALSAANAGSISYQRTATMLKSSLYSKISWDELKPADLFLKNGHVMMFVGMSGSKYAVFECDAGDSKCSYNVYTKAQLSSYSCYRYNNFSSFDVSVPTDLGTNFTAVILNKAAWKPIENRYMDGDKPAVRIADETGYANQVWYFVRQSDGSYMISSCQDGKYLDVRDAANGPNVVIQTCVASGSDAQKWYIYEESGGYIIKSKLSGYVIDLVNNDSASGTHLQTFEYNGSGAQIWAFYRGEECSLRGPKLSVVAGDSKSGTKFTWDEVYGESRYDVKIWKNKAWEGDAYHVEWGTKSGYTLNLPAGTYQAYVDAANYYDCKPSNVVTFTVQEHNCTNSSVVTKPTCTEKGYTAYTCKTCGNSYNGDYTDALGHSNSYKITTKPTTSAAGVLTGTCSRCKGTTTVQLPKLNTMDYTYKVNTAATCTKDGTGNYTWKTTSYGTFSFDAVIPKTGHAYTSRVIAPSCTHEGYTKYTCTCGDTYTQNQVAALGHQWNDGSVTKEPTEEAEGQMLYLCTREGCYDFKVETILPLEHIHSYESKVIAPTCTEKGYTIHTCACGDSYTDSETEALGHSWDDGKVTTEPTEETSGVKTFTCAVCEATKTEVVPPLEHTHKYTDTVTAPTCTEGGYTTHTCACGDSYTDSETEALGHSWDDGKVTTEPTEETSGVKTFTCTVCNETKTEGIPPLEHTHSYESRVTAPACTEKGYTTHTCACGDSYTDSETEALGHSWDDGEVTKEATETEAGVKTYTCDTCGETKTETIPALDHTHSYTSKVTAPTCTAGGYTTHTCACGDSYTDGETAALGHTEVVDSEVHATCTETGLTEGKHCSVCGTVLVKQEEIKALGHGWLNGSCQVCGAVDPDREPEEEGKITRLAGDNRFLTAILSADAMKENLGIMKFDAVIVASGTNFADALSGSYLAAVKNAPILLSCNEDFNPNLVDKYNTIVLDYIKENLSANGVVYILGGPKAVAPALDEKLDGYHVKRLAGANRYETNIRILEEAGVDGKDILVCNGEGFADSLSASAAELPILLVNSVYGIFNVQKPFLESCKEDFYIIGGESAVSLAVEMEIIAYGNVQRIGGKNRFETSVAIAEKFFDDPDSAVLAYAWNFPDGLCGGALAATMDAPLILTMDKYEARAAEYIQNKTIKNGFILGGETLISNNAVNTIFAMAE